jgi:hypothetical protein
MGYRNQRNCPSAAACRECRSGNAQAHRDEDDVRRSKFDLSALFASRKPFERQAVCSESQACGVDRVTGVNFSLCSGR